LHDVDGVVTSIEQLGIFEDEKKNIRIVDDNNNGEGNNNNNNNIHQLIPRTRYHSYRKTLKRKEEEWCYNNESSLLSSSSSPSSSPSSSSPSSSSSFSNKEPSFYSSKLFPIDIPPSRTSLLHACPSTRLPMFQQCVVDFLFNNANCSPNNMNSTLMYHVLGQYNVNASKEERKGIRDLLSGGKVLKFGDKIRIDGGNDKEKPSVDSSVVFPTYLRKEISDVLLKQHHYIFNNPSLHNNVKYLFFFLYDLPLDMLFVLSPQQVFFFFFFILKGKNVNYEVFLILLLLLFFYYYFFILLRNYFFEHLLKHQIHTRCLLLETSVSHSHSHHLHPPLTQETLLYPRW
jgi:hypothetical protein